MTCSWDLLFPRISKNPDILVPGGMMAVAAQEAYDAELLAQAAEDQFGGGESL